MMTAGVRKLALTTHVTASVGWLGSVVAFLALAIAGVSSAESEIVRAAYVSMHLMTWYVIVPLAFGSFLTGLIEGIGTPWGLFRYYWILTKLILTVLATAILLLHTQPIDRVATVAMRAVLTTSDLQAVRIRLIGDASAALFVLFVTTTLSVYKPWGMTPYGVRQQLVENEGLSRAARREPRATGGYVLIGIVAFVGIIVVLHWFGVGLHAH